MAVKLTSAHYYINYLAVALGNSAARGSILIAYYILERAKENTMKIWTSEHIFNHNWDTVVQSQFRKYPNPHNTAVLGTDVYDRRVDPVTGVLHSHRIITSGKLFKS